jgi:hypothetical protein
MNLVVRLWKRGMIKVIDPVEILLPRVAPTLVFMSATRQPVLQPALASSSSQAHTYRVIYG